MHNNRFRACLSVCLSVTRLLCRPLSSNSSEMAWNFQTPFYRMGTDSLRMVYVNFHKSICLRDFSGTATLIRVRVAAMMAR